MTLTAHTRLGPYEIIDKLGAGGMGEVYRARDTRLDRDVAIKILPERFAEDRQALSRFEREVKAVAALSHPNIITIYDIGIEHGITFAVIELLGGETLASRIAKAALDGLSALKIAISIAEGLSAAHSKGIIHRDIKPENIFLTTDGGVKVLDFGLVRLEISLTGAGATVGLETMPGVVMGTVSYMSPEQVRGEPADARSDIFAFGCVLYEMVGGRQPFSGKTGPETFAAILNAPPPPLPETVRELPSGMEEIIARCLDKDPAKRFASASELASALNTISSKVSSGARTEAYKVDTGVMSIEGTVTLDPPKTVTSVAVLPFVNMSADPENEYFSDGLAEELIAVLTKVAGLHVASRTSAFAFKGKNEDMRRIGEQLNVRSVLEGSVRKAGNRLRISTQLVNVDDGFQLWSETYNRQLEDVFAIQDEIAQSIASALRLVLNPKLTNGTDHAQPANVKAYDYYLRGRKFFHQWSRKDFEFALKMFSRSIDIDPDYDRAYTGLADCYAFLYLNWDANEENLQKASKASRHALELDPNLAEAHVSRGFVLTLEKQFGEAQKEFEIAIQQDPNLFEARYFYGRACLAEGELEKAAELFKQACEMRPDDYQAASHLSSVYTGLGRKEDANNASRRCLQVVENHQQMHPDDARAFCLGAVVCEQLGESERAIQWADQALAIDPNEPVTLYNVACTYALQGLADRAIDCLDKAIKNGFSHKEWIENDADFNSLRNNQRFEALIEQL